MLQDAEYNLKEYVKLLPHKPGVYLFFNSSDVVIYIGKAKDLQKRVNSYFVKRHDNRKTAVLVKNIRKVQHLVVETEQDAFLLENNLIKKYQPRYNIRLKDDKSYPWICIKNEPFPRVFMTRNLIRDGSKYFGPYTSVYTVRTLLDLFKKEYKLRTCNYQLTDENIKNRKYKVCLEYHIGNCEAPCEGKISKEKYDQGIQEIINILKGNIHGVTQHLEKQMKEYADSMNFEAAQLIKDKYDSLKKYQSRSTVVSSSIADVDVYSIDLNPKFAFVNYLKVINGSIIKTYTLEIKRGLEDTEEDLLIAAILDIREKIPSDTKEIIVPFIPSISLNSVVFKVPKQGDKRKLLDLSLRNAKYSRLEKEKQQLLKSHTIKGESLLKNLQKDLNLKELPVRIECFDNSNIQGAYPVAACVVFINGRPAKSEYRHFNIKTVEGPNDFASMEEVVYRRYKRAIQERRELPQLIVIDGGKGQLSSALKALEKLSIRDKVAIIGIAERLEEIYFPNDPVPLFINKNSITLKVIRRIRDEAHRFGVTYHRNRRSNASLVSQLTNIQGIGVKTTEKLLKEFKSVKNIEGATLNSLIEVVGEHRANLIHLYFSSKESKKEE